MSATRIDVADLLRHGGARRPVRKEVTIRDLAVGGVRITGPLELDLVLERVHEGVVVHGTVRAEWEAECANCLAPITDEVVVPVHELFEAHPMDGETYPLEGHEVDLEQLLRDSALLELPLAPNCAATGIADCHRHDDAEEPAPAPEADAPPDPRWATLSQLKL